MQLVQCIATENNIELVAIESNLTIAKAMQGTHLRKVKEEIGTIQTITAITALVLRQKDFFNVKGNINQSQAATIAGDLLEIFGYETIEDIVMMFKMARQGQIGEKVWKLDTDTIFNQWVPAYMDLKSQEREKMHKKTKESGVIDLKKKDVENPEAFKKFGELLNKLEKNKSERKEVQGHTNFIKDVRMNAGIMSKEQIEKKIIKAKELGLEMEVLILENALKVKEIRGIEK